MKFSSSLPPGPSPTAPRPGGRRRAWWWAAGAAVAAAAAVWLFCEPAQRRATTAEDVDRGGKGAFDDAWAGLASPEQLERDELFRQNLTRIDQWARQQAPVPWELDPMVAPLVDRLAPLVEEIEAVGRRLVAPRDRLILKLLAVDLGQQAAAAEAFAREHDLQAVQDRDKQWSQTLRKIRDDGQATQRQLYEADPQRAAQKRRKNPLDLPEFDPLNEGRKYAAMEQELERHTFEILLKSTPPPQRPLRDYALRLAKALDDETTLSDFARAKTYAAALGAFRDAGGTPQTLNDMAAQIAGIAKKAGVPQPQRLLGELGLAATLLGNPAAVAAHVAWKELLARLDSVQDRLDAIARRSGDADLKELVGRLVAAIRPLDPQQLATLPPPLAELARLDSPQDIDAVADLLVPEGRRLQETGRAFAATSKALGLEHGPTLGTQVAGLGLDVAGLAEHLQRLAAEAPQDIPRAIGAAAQTAFEASGIVNRLAGALKPLAGIGVQGFPESDGAALQQAAWLADLARWTAGDEPDDVQRAARIFDWVVRNVQLAPDTIDVLVRGASPPGGPPAAPQRRQVPRPLRMPWQTLLEGRGTALERAWVFVLLCRQQGIEAGLLVAEGGNPHQPLAVGVLEEKGLHRDRAVKAANVFVFDPRLGVPVPQPGKLTCDATGGLALRPATLGQLAADDALLRRLDTRQPYPATAAQLRKVTVLLEAAPLAVSRRSALIQPRLGGQAPVIVAAPPGPAAKRWRACPQVADVQVWRRPYDAILYQAANPASSGLPPRLGQVKVLVRARTLYVRGRIDGQHGAIHDYTEARKLGLNQPPGVPPQALAELPQPRADANYWIGLAHLEQGFSGPDKGLYASARDYLENKTLGGDLADPWFGAARYNLGRIGEWQKRYAEAVKYYRDSAGEPDTAGKELRARWLEEATGMASTGAAADRPAKSDDLDLPEPTPQIPKP